MASQGLLASLVLNFATAFQLLTGVVLAYTAVRVIYNLYFHPLRSFPGPLANRITDLTIVSWLFNGCLPYKVADLHAHYGRVVRIAPNELSFIDPQAWKDIYSRHGGGRYEIPQDFSFYNAVGVDHPSLIGCEREEHDAVRKLLSSGFSDRAMKAQEPVIGGYVDLLIQRISDNAVDAQGTPQTVNLRDWFAYTTFDVLGKLAFGSDFGCLRGSTYHPWVHLIIGNVKDLAVLNGLRRLGILPYVTYLMQKLGVGNQKRKLHNELTTERTKQRIDMGTGHDDFLDGLVKSNMSVGQITRNSSLLIVAGSETTATLLAGVTFFITTHPEVLEKLKTEVRGRFSSESEITLTSVTSLTYMLAVLNEALRMYPPSPNVAPRRVGPGGADIAGQHVPEGGVVGIWQWPLYHDPELFADPDHFDPERWVNKSETSKYANDRLDAVNPFLTGPRNCLGQNLAYAEMRLILARLVWNFDLAITEGSREWLHDQRSYLLWDKPDLDIYLTPAKR